MSSALPIVSALMPVLSDRKNTGVADASRPRSAVAAPVEVMGADRMPGSRSASRVAAHAVAAVSVTAGPAAAIFIVNS